MGIRLVKYGTSNSTGTYNHDELQNRDLPNQHPISAIDGLEDRLNQIEKCIEYTNEEIQEIVAEINDRVAGYNLITNDGLVIMLNDNKILVAKAIE